MVEHRGVFQESLCSLAGTAPGVTTGQRSGGFDSKLLDCGERFGRFLKNYFQNPTNDQAHAERQVGTDQD